VFDESLLAGRGTRRGQRQPQSSIAGSAALEPFLRWMSLPRKDQRT